MTGLLSTHLYKSESLRQAFGFQKENKIQFSKIQIFELLKFRFSNVGFVEVWGLQKHEEITKRREFATKSSAASVTRVTIYTNKSRTVLSCANLLS